MDPIQTYVTGVTGSLEGLANEVKGQSGLIKGPNTAARIKNILKDVVSYAKANKNREDILREVKQTPAFNKLDSDIQRQVAYRILQVATEGKAQVENPRTPSKERPAPPARSPLAPQTDSIKPQRSPRADPDREEKIRKLDKEGPPRRKLPDLPDEPQAPDYQAPKPPEKK